MEGTTFAPSSPGVGEDSPASLATLFEENMSTVLYALASAIIFACFAAHGCLFYRRWKRRRRTSGEEDGEVGWSSPGTPGKDRVKGTSSQDDSVASVADSEQRSRSNSVQLLDEARSSTKSLLDQDPANDRRRSSSIRVKVLPPPAVGRSTSGPERLAGRPSDEGNPADARAGSDTKLAQAALISELVVGLGYKRAPRAPVAAERSDAPRPSLDAGQTAADGGPSPYEQIGGRATDVCSAPAAVDGPQRARSGSNKSVPAILHTQPSEENYDRLEPRDLTNRATVSRQSSKDSPEEIMRLKRRSHSFDHVPAFGESGAPRPDWQLPGPARNRSASASHPSPKPGQLNAGAAQPDPVYFTLEPTPDADGPTASDKRYRTLPHIGSTTVEQPSSPTKRKFTLNALFSRKSRRAEKRRDKPGAETPPGSPGKSSVDQSQAVIYEEPEGDTTGLGDYSTVNPDNQLDVGRDGGGGKSDGGSPSKSKAGFLKSLHISRTKSKSVAAKQPTPQKRPARNVCDDDFSGAYEVLEIPMGDAAAGTAGGPVYDTPESTALSADKATAPSLTVIGATPSGTPLRQYRPGSARRELPSTPHDYDVIQRGDALSQRAVARSNSAKSTGASTGYERLGSVVPGHVLQAAVNPARRSSSPGTARRDADRAYEQLNPGTMGAADRPGGGKPGVGPKPQSLRGVPSGSDYELLHSGPLSRHGSFGARPKPKIAPRPLLRANSLSKLRKVSPAVSSKPSENHGAGSAKPSQSKPALASKPAVAHGVQARGPDPVYFTLDPNSTAQPV